MVTLEKTKEQITRFKKKNPIYKELLDFYGLIAEELFKSKPHLSFPSSRTKEEVRKIQMSEGFPIMNMTDFVLDIPSSVKLFESVCTLAKNATTKLNKNIQKIENAVKAGKLKREKLIEKHHDSAYLEEIAKKLKIDKTVLNFLIHMSIKPSIHINVEKFQDTLDLKNWLRGYCPVCGSLPLMSVYNSNGQRYYHCSFCDFQWPGERLKCPFCENADHKKLHYLYAEGQEAYRVDVCDKCKQYIKTVDSRKLDYEPDLALEDIMTIHLDIIASEKGFKRPVASLWGV